jgi:hypothetical protein
VVRFGPETSWYEADRMAMAFVGPDLPVPEVREVGYTPSGRAYAISVRHPRRFLENTPVDQAGAIAATLTRLLVALYRVPAGPDAPVVWHHGAAPTASWREYLLDGLVDDPGKLVHGWSAALAADPGLAALSQAVTERVRTLVAACPERRDLVHGDLLHGNVLVSPGRPPGRGGAVLEVLGTRRLPLRCRLVQLLGALCRIGTGSAPCPGLKDGVSLRPGLAGLSRTWAKSLYICLQALRAVSRRPRIRGPIKKPVLAGCHV